MNDEQVRPNEKLRRESDSGNGQELCGDIQTIRVFSVQRFEPSSSPRLIRKSKAYPIYMAAIKLPIFAMEKFSEIYNNLFSPTSGFRAIQNGKEFVGGVISLLFHNAGIVKVTKPHVRNLNPE